MTLSGWMDGSRMGGLIMDGWTDHGWVDGSRMGGWITDGWITDGWMEVAAEQG